MVPITIPLGPGHGGLEELGFDRKIGDGRQASLDRGGALFCSCSRRGQDGAGSERQGGSARETVHSCCESDCSYREHSVFAVAQRLKMR